MTRLALDPARVGAEIADFSQRMAIAAAALGTMDVRPEGCTPRTEVLRRGKTILWRYRREAADAGIAPLVICYALVNRPYMLDLQADRDHPTKKNRPFASGRVPVTLGLALVPILTLAAFAVAWLVSPLFLAVLAGYYALTNLYSLNLKRRMVLDVVALALLYTLRVLGGAVAMPIAGRLADMIGKKPVLIGSALILVAGSLVCALSSSATLVIAGRVLQGLAMGFIPVAISLVRELSLAHMRNTAVAGVSATLGVGGALGLPLAAWIAQDYNWHILFWVAFGLATIGFGLSTSLWLSLFCLFVLGAADMISVFVRQTLVQADTPDAMRGRVAAVNAVFIGASNELGEFESGLLAALVGTVPAVVLGGLGTLAVAGLWARWFPALRDRDRLVG